MIFRWKDTAICGYKSGKVGFLYKYPKLHGLKNVSFTVEDNKVLVKCDVGEWSKDALDVVKSKVQSSVVPVLDFLSSSYKTFIAKRVEHKPVVKTENVSVSLAGSVANVTIDLPDSWKEESEIVHIYALDGVLGASVNVLQVFEDYVKSTKSKWDDYIFGLFKYGYKLVMQRFGTADPV